MCGYLIKLKILQKEKYLWLRNNLSTLSSQALDTFIYTFVWVIAGELIIFVALSIALTKYIFKVIIAIIDTLFIYVVRNWTPLMKKIKKLLLFSQQQEKLMRL